MKARASGDRSPLSAPDTQNLVSSAGPERRPTKPEVARSNRARGTNAGLAQLAERRPPKPKVRGSTPWSGARHLDVAKWPKASGCKPEGASPRPFALAGVPARTLRSNGPKAERSEQSDRRVQASLAQLDPERRSTKPEVARSSRARGATRTSSLVQSRCGAAGSAHASGA